MSDLPVKWFIRVANAEQAKAVQEWAFEQGFGWSGSKTIRKDLRLWEIPAAIGHGHFDGMGLGQASVDYWIANGHKEIKVTFKTAVDKVVLTEVESLQQKQIRELQETIAKAQEQIESLKKVI